jgi:hypothetical protein
MSGHGLPSRPEPGSPRSPPRSYRHDEFEYRGGGGGGGYEGPSDRHYDAREPRRDDERWGGEDYGECSLLPYCARTPRAAS